MTGLKTIAAGLIGLALAMGAAPSHSAESGQSGAEETRPTSNALEFVRLKFYHSKKCVTVPANSLQNVWLNQHTCLGQDNQLWQQQDVGGGYVRFVNQHSKKCMNVQGNSQSPGAHIIQYPCGGYPNEHFILETDHFPVDTYWIKSRGPQLAITIPQKSQLDGVGVIQEEPCVCTNTWVTVVPIA